jgi:hypothetical protein
MSSAERPAIKLAALLCSRTGTKQKAHAPADFHRRVRYAVGTDEKNTF